MLNTLVFENSIIIFWDRLPLSKDGYYQVLLDGKEVGHTKKTHYTLQGLTPSTEYVVKVLLCRENERKEVDTVCVTTQAKKRRIDVTKAPYNAIGDGKTLNTLAMQKAIDDCAAGDCVYIPQGEFLSGALNLRSDMELYLDKGAVLLGSTQVEDYAPKINSRFEGLEMQCFSALLNVGVLDKDAGYTTKNVVIRGEGKIVGGGKELCQNVIDSETAILQEYLASLGDKILEYERADTIAGRVRPRLINISNAQNVAICGVGIEKGPSWNVHIIYSDSVVTCGCRFESFGIRNGDGWDPDSSTNCTIFDCVFNVGDDCIAIKSGKNPEGNIIGKPCENIKIFDCKTEKGHGIAIGSEISGGIENVYVWDCNFEKSLCGLHIKTTKKRGGYVKNVFVDDSKLGSVNIRTVHYNDDGESSNQTTVFDNIALNNVYVAGLKYLDEARNEPCEAIVIAQEGFILKRMTMNNITIGDSHLTDIQAIDCFNEVTLTNVTCVK